MELKKLASTLIASAVLPFADLNAASPERAEQIQALDGESITQVQKYTRTALAFTLLGIMIAYRNSGKQQL